MYVAYLFLALCKSLPQLVVAADTTAAVAVAVAVSLLLFIVLCVLCIVCECNVNMLLLYDLHAVLELWGVRGLSPPKLINCPPPLCFSVRQPRGGCAKHSNALV